MPAAPNKGLKVAIQNTPQAKDDAFGIGEDSGAINYLNVLANDGGGGAATVWGLAAGPAPTNLSSLLNTGATSPTITLVSGATATIQPDGTIAYDTTNISFDLDTLAQGETYVDTFTYVIRLANGAFSVAQATVTITGANDPPVAQAEVLEVLEGASASGQMDATDVDNGAVLTFSQTSPAVAGLQIDSDGSFVFDAAHSAYDHLAAGVKQEIEVSFEVRDEFGATDTEVLTITVTGVNDVAVISGDDTGSVTEDAVQTASGLLLVDDLDDGEDAFNPATLSGLYGDLDIDADGSWVFTLDNDAAQSLGDDDHIEETFTVSSVDGTEHTITITVNGADEPFVYVPPTVFTGTGDPNDFDSLGNAAGQNTSSSSTNGPDTLYGGAGDDTINAGGGADTVYGGSGNDQLGGGNAGDGLYGGSGADTINGQNDADNIIGGYGADTLTGGGGNDVFRYLSNHDTGDTITDFNQNGDDSFNMEALAGGNLSYQGQVLTEGLVAANSVSWFNAAAGSTYVYVDSTGDGVADIEIHLLGVNSLSAADFTL